jgi:hypothetical protein
MLEYPTRKPKTGDLGAVKYEIPLSCPTCLKRYCSYCGACHTFGCKRARVLCESVQRELMRRDSYPDDRPLRRPWWKFWR